MSLLLLFVFPWTFEPFLFSVLCFVLPRLCVLYVGVVCKRTQATELHEVEIERSMEKERFPKGNKKDFCRCCKKKEQL